MPIVNADVKGLEFRTAVWYGDDATGYKEIRSGVDTHSENQRDLQLPEGKDGRLIAKKFVFRLIFGGNAFGFSVDPEFAHIKGSERYWQKVVDAFYDKYTGIADWHRRIIEEAKRTGQLTSASGRVYHFAPELKRGESRWPEPKIKNYPVQGFGADIVALARIAVFRRLYPHRDKGILLINTVHDSIMVDCRTELVPFVCQTINDVMAELPGIISRCFGIKFDMPMAVEIEAGPNYKDLSAILV